MPEPPAGSGPAGTTDDPLANHFHAACEQHLDFVWRFAVHRGVASSDLPHVVHKVFGVLRSRMISLEHAEELRVAVATVTRNVVRGFLRTDLSVHSPLDPATNDLDIVTERDLRIESLEHKTESELVALILQHMSEPEREVFILCEMEGFTLFETAEALHVTESRLRTRLDDACKLFNRVSADFRAQRYWVTRQGPQRD